MREGIRGIRKVVSDNKRDNDGVDIPREIGPVAVPVFYKTIILYPNFTVTTKFFCAL